MLLKGQVTKSTNFGDQKYESAVTKSTNFGDQKYESESEVIHRLPVSAG
jgi:hypothetical protein